MQPSDERLVTETHYLVAATIAGAAASLLVAIAAVAMPIVQLQKTEKLRILAQAENAKLDSDALLSFVNYFGEQLALIEQSSGQSAAPSRVALRQAMTRVLVLMGSLSDRFREEATFAFIDAYRVAAQSAQDDKMLLATQEAFNTRRREVQAVSTPQSPQIAKRLEEDEARFKVTRAQIEEMTRKNASQARQQLDQLSRDLGGSGVLVRSEGYFANPQDGVSDRFASS